MISPNVIIAPPLDEEIIGPLAHVIMKGNKINSGPWPSRPLFSSMFFIFFMYFSMLLVFLRFGGSRRV